MMAVQNTKDVHAECVLFLHPPRDCVFSREPLVDKLSFPSVVYITGGRQTAYSSHLFLDFRVHTTSGEQAEILFEAPPVFIVGLETLLAGSLVHPIEKVHIDCLILGEKIFDIFLV